MWHMTTFHHQPIYQTKIKVYIFLKTNKTTLNLFPWADSIEINPTLLINAIEMEGLCVIVISSLQYYAHAQVMFLRK